MTVRGAAFTAALLLSATLLAACGPAAAPGGTQGPAVTPAPATVAPGVTGGPGVSFDMPNEAEELEALLPDQIGGDNVEKLSMDGESFLGEGSGSEDLLAVLSQFGKTPADVSVAFGATTGDTTGNVSVQVAAFRINGVDANQVFQAFVQLVGSADGDVVSDASFGGKSVKKVVSAEGDTTYLYASGDVLFTVDAPGDIDPEILNEVFSKLR